MSGLVRWDALLCGGVWTVELGQCAPSVLVQPYDESELAKERALLCAMALSRLVRVALDREPDAVEIKDALEALKEAGTPT